jgi:hypothetical protein
MLRRRLSIRIEQTEVTLSIGEVSTGSPAQPGAASVETAPSRHCPVCGAIWLPDLLAFVGKFHLTAAQLRLAASEGKLHLFCSPDNEVWVCERSIQEMRGAVQPSQLSPATSTGPLEEISTGEINHVR